MLRAYLSYTPADKEYLKALVRWLRPLEQKYALHVWHAPLPPPGTTAVYPWEEATFQLEQAHLYLFLTSTKSIRVEHIQKEEIPRALKRQTELGKALVRLYRIPLYGSESTKALDRIPILGAAYRIDDWKNDRLGYEFLTKAIEEEVRQLLREWQEEAFRTQKSLMASSDVSGPAVPQRLRPIPGWLSAAFLFAILYIVTSIYFEQCAPRRYDGLPPNVSVPFSPSPEEYRRENPQDNPTPVRIRLDTSQSEEFWPGLPFSVPSPSD